MVHRLPYLDQYLIQTKAKTPPTSVVGTHVIKNGLIYLGYVLHASKTCKTDLIEVTNGKTIM